MRGHLVFKTTLRGGLYREVPLYGYLLPISILLQILYILPFMRGHLAFKTTLRGGLYREVPLYVYFVAHFHFAANLVYLPFVRDHLAFKTTLTGGLYREVPPHGYFVAHVCYFVARVCDGCRLFQKKRKRRSLQPRIPRSLRGRLLLRLPG